RVGGRVSERREAAAELVELASLLPDGADNVDHLPVGDPLAAGALALFPLGPGNRSLHAARDAGRGTDRDVRFHPTLPQRTLAQLIRRVAGAAHAVLVGPHVAVGHRDGV